MVFRFSDLSRTTDVWSSKLNKTKPSKVRSGNFRKTSGKTPTWEKNSSRPSKWQGMISLHVGRYTVVKTLGQGVLRIFDKFLVGALRLKENSRGVSLGSAGSYFYLQMVFPDQVYWPTLSILKTICIARENRIRKRNPNWWSSTTRCPWREKIERTRESTVRQWRRRAIWQNRRPRFRKWRSKNWRPNSSPPN